MLALGARCRKLRIKKGYSIDRLAKEGAQLSPGAIQRLETGSADVQVSLLYRYAEVLEIPLKTIFDFDYDVDSSESRVLPYVEGEAPPKNAVPFYSVEVAAGVFSDETYDIEPQGWVIISKKGTLKDYFVVRVTGRSMEPTISSGALCLLRRYSGGSRNGKILLVQARGMVDPESGGSFVIKRYQRITPVGEDEDRKNVIVHLLSDNPNYPPIVLKKLQEEEISTPAVFVEVLD